eukprot:m.8780 g.8780  ORF g.8780 m.8780 type:complete len:418 (-) comp5287_c0_seq2:28-1281(-)
MPRSALAVCLLLLLGMAHARQYLCVNLAPGQEWNQDRPQSVTPALLANIAKTIGTAGNANLGLCVSFLLSVLQTPTPVLNATLSAILAASAATNISVAIGIDGQNWWEARPDLWNWWDPARPGYNPSNIANVEWTDFARGSNTSGPGIKISWRDWGSQIRVAPGQNIHSPAVRAATTAGALPLFSTIAAWSRREELLAGVVVGWETGIGVNAYYYPDGNSFEERYPDDASHDPNHPFRPEDGITYGFQQLGFAAATAAGLRAPGDTRPLAAADIAVLSQWTLANLTRLARLAGVPTNRVFTHLGGNDPPYSLHVPFSAAFTPDSSPGWSFYRTTPNNIAEIGQQMAAAGRTTWAAVEWWLPGSGSQADWTASLTATLRFLSCHMTLIFNWESIAAAAPALAALQVLLATWHIEPTVA